VGQRSEHMNDRLGIWERISISTTVLTKDVVTPEDHFQPPKIVVCVAQCGRCTILSHNPHQLDIAATCTHEISFSTDPCDGIVLRRFPAQSILDHSIRFGTPHFQASFKAEQQQQEEIGTQRKKHFASSRFQE
jgi:hypothetical protein